MATVTITSIAKEAGVSIATVSRVLNNTGYPVAENTKATILEIAKKNNYHTNLIGRMLKKNDAMDIGVIVPTIQNPFYTQIVAGIEQEAKKQGYNIMLCNSQRDTRIEQKYIYLLQQKQVRGIIIASVNQQYQELLDAAPYGVHFTFIDQEVSTAKVNQVYYDYYEAGKMATDYLIKIGHKEIAFCTSPLNRRNRINLYNGYKDALEKHGQVVQSSNLIITKKEMETADGNYEFQSGKELAQKFYRMKQKATAILAVNDMTAFGIIQTLNELGVSVPEDVSVMGFDDISFSKMFNPALTTIRHPAVSTGEEACRLLINAIEGKCKTGIEIEMKPELILRKSVKARVE